MDEILERIGDQEGVTGLLLIALSSALEYIFPPLPGDAVTIFAAFLVSARGWSPILVLASMTIGSLAGGMLHYWIGIVLGRRGWTPKTLRGGQILHGVQTVAARFQRHGAGYLAINRFIPGLRAFFFLAAGYVHMRPAQVLLWGGVSALAWSSVLLGLGHVAGDNRDRLESLLRTYSTVGWALVGVVALALAIRWLWLRYRRRHGSP